MPVGIEVRAEGLVEAIALYNGARGRWADRLQKAATEFGENAVLYIQKRYRTGGTTSTRTRVRSGRLRRSYSYKVQQTGGVRGEGGVDIDLGVLRSKGADSKTLAYAAAQEYGAKIRPTKSKYLAVPLDAALTRAGVPKGSPRDFSDTFIVNRRGKSPIIFQRRANGAVPLFALVRGVTIPARPALAPTAEALRPKLEERAIEDLRTSIHG